MPILDPYTGPTPAGSMGIPGTGSQPDYSALALSSPQYQAWLTGARAKVSGAGDVRRQAAQFAALNYGGLPPGFQDAYGDLTPDILAQAQANPQSTVARLQQGYAAAGQQLQTSMAARGALHSGDLVAGQQNLDTGFAANQSDAANQFINAMTGPGGTYQGYTDAQTQAMSGQGDALNQAIQTLQADPTNQPGPDTPATLVNNWQAQYGRPMYSGPDGKLYALDPSTGQLGLYSYPDPSYPGGTAYTGL